MTNPTEYSNPKAAFANKHSKDKLPKQVRGRFAPSPSGPLHFGSLLAALGSYLHAKSNNGLWFVRIEDIDTTRVQAGAADEIMDALVAFGMQWDVDENTQEFLNDEHHGCLFQTARLNRYQEYFNTLASQDLLYGCDCTRKEIKAQGPYYSGHCRERNLGLNGNPVRLKASGQDFAFNDLVFGHQTAPEEMCNEDYIVKRRDGLFSYQLVVVADDIDQAITHVVRGADIMPLTTRQISLYKQLGVEPPQFLHLPLAVTSPGQKLSKQNHAKAINIQHPQPELLKALKILGLPIEEEPSLINSPSETIVKWAVNHVDFLKLSDQQEIII